MGCEAVKMNEEGFRSFLKKQRRSEGTIDQCVQFAREFEAYVAEYRDAKDLDEAAPYDLEAFVSWTKQQRKSINSYLWAIHRYYEYTLNDSMRRRATDMRKQEIAKGRARRKPLRLRDIQGPSTEHVERLEAIGITDVEAVLEVGRTKEGREQLSRRSGLPTDEVLRFVKLADLTRIVDIKGLRVRLLWEAGVDTAENVSGQDAKMLRDRLAEVNGHMKILKRNPTLVETSYWVAQAKALTRIVDY
jgi:hypothetical protein